MRDLRYLIIGLVVKAFRWGHHYTFCVSAAYRIAVWLVILRRKNSGYMRQMLVRAGEKSYLTAKFLATFIAGGLAMVVPLIINFMLTAMFIPAITPVPTYDTMYGVLAILYFKLVLYTAICLCSGIYAG